VRGVRGASVLLDRHGSGIPVVVPDGPIPVAIATPLTVTIDGDTTWTDVHVGWACLVQIEHPDQ